MVTKKIIERRRTNYSGRTPWPLLGSIRLLLILRRNLFGIISLLLTLIRTGRLKKSHTSHNRCCQQRGICRLFRLTGGLDGHISACDSFALYHIRHKRQYPFSVSNPHNSRQGNAAVIISCGSGVCRVCDLLPPGIPCRPSASVVGRVSPAHHSFAFGKRFEPAPHRLPRRLPKAPDISGSARLRA